jgi:hypothetical protein
MQFVPFYANLLPFSQIGVIKLFFILLGNLFRPMGGNGKLIAKSARWTARKQPDCAQLVMIYGTTRVKGTPSIRE